MTAMRDPILRVVPGPEDINANGHIFGGWVLSQMDKAGGIIARKVAQGACATVAINAIDFLAPIHLRDVVSVYGEVIKRGRTSMGIRIEVVATRFATDEDVRVTEGVFTFVAVDDEFKPKALPAG
jgi:acyl-CoA thioesterase YciA